MLQDIIQGTALLPISMALSRSLRPSETVGSSATGAGGGGAGAMGAPGGIGGGGAPGCIAIGGGGGGGAGTFGRTGGGGGPEEYPEIPFGGRYGLSGANGTLDIFEAEKVVIQHDILQKNN